MKASSSGDFSFQVLFFYGTRGLLLYPIHPYPRYPISSKEGGGSGALRGHLRRAPPTSRVVVAVAAWSPTVSGSTKPNTVRIQCTGFRRRQHIGWSCQDPALKFMLAWLTAQPLANSCGPWCRSPCCRSPCCRSPCCRSPWCRSPWCRSPWCRSPWCRSPCCRSAPSRTTPTHVVGKNYLEIV